METSPLFRLPDEILLNVIEYLSAESLAAFVKTSRHARRIGNKVLYAQAGTHVQDFVHWKSAGESGYNFFNVANYERRDEWRPPLSKQARDYQALLAASGAGSTETVRALLADGVLPEPPEGEKPCPGEDIPLCTPLTVAARLNHVEIVDMLLTAGADLKSYQANHAYNILFTGKGIDNPMRETLIRHGLTLNGLIHGHRNLLHEVCRRPYSVADVEFLLDNGIGVNSLCDQGQTPLWYAIKSINFYSSDLVLSVVRLLLRRGAALDTRSAIDHRLPLHIAAQEGTPEMVQLLLEFGADVNARSLDGATALHSVCFRFARRRNRIVKTLLDAGASPAIGLVGRPQCNPLVTSLRLRELQNLRSVFDGWLAQNITQQPQLLFVAAAAVGHIPTLQKLLKQGQVDVDAAFDGNTALAVAAGEGNLEAVELLLPLVSSSAFSFLNEKSDSRTALHAALASGDERIVRLLLPLTPRGVLDLVDARRSTPLNEAVRHQPTAVVSLLLDRMQSDTADTGLPNGWAQLTPQDSSRPRNFPHRYNNFQITHVPKDVLLSTALHAAIEKGKVEAVHLLLEQMEPSRRAEIAGWALDRQYSFTMMPVDKTPLIRAAQHGYIDMVKALIAAGVDIDAQDTDGSSALMHAVVRGHPEVVQYLVERGADTSAPIPLSIQNPIYPSESILHYVAIQGYGGILDMLLARGADVNEVDRATGRSCLSWAAVSGQTDVVRSLLAHQPCLTLQDNYNRTALNLVIEEGDPDIVRLLLDAGAKANLPVDGGGDFPLHLLAMRRPKPAVADVILQHGVDINQRNREGNTPLILLAKNAFCFSEHVQWFIDHGADVNAVGRDGRTAVSWAAQKGSFGAVRALVSAGGDILIADKEGKLPLNYATHDKVVGALYACKN